MVVVERLASSGEWRLARTVVLCSWEECLRRWVTKAEHEWRRRVVRTVTRYWRLRDSEGGLKSACGDCIEERIGCYSEESKVVARSTTR